MIKKKTVKLITTLIATFLVIISTYFVTNEEDQVSNREQVILVRVVDGDTAYFITPTYGEVSIRFSGVNTPELNKKEYLAVEAKEFTSNILENGKVIEVEWDLTQGPSGDRIIGIIFVDDVNLNLLLVEEGYANLIYLKDTMPYAEKYIEAEKKAKDEKIGIWKNEGE